MVEKKHASELERKIFELILSFPEILIGVVALEVLIGKWRGLRLLEYPRFYDLVRREKVAP